MKLDAGISAVVTGGASGLGLATVKALRATGAAVAIFDLNDEAGVAREDGRTRLAPGVLASEQCVP